MKKILGNFVKQEDFDNFILWKTKSNNEFFETLIPNSQFSKDGHIIFDETTIHGKKLYDYLLLNGWIEDIDYDPLASQKQEEQRKLEEQTRLAEQKKIQDQINETENKPIILEALKQLKYPEKTDTEISAMTFDELAEYHSKMVLKQNKILELLELKKLDTKDITNWNNEGKKTLLELETEIKSLKTNNE